MIQCCSKHLNNDIGDKRQRDCVSKSVSQYPNSRLRYYFNQLNDFNIPPNLLIFHAILETLTRKVTATKGAWA